MSSHATVSRLFFSAAVEVAPALQAAREREFLGAAARGEAHLHVSTLTRAPTLSLGRFHRHPEPSPDIALWVRQTGGRAVAAAPGFTLVTLALPHRAALVSSDRRALAPAQVLNRCVRGILSALRGLDVDVNYPGLDLLTHDRRALAALSFIEAGGPTLFQAILATAAPLSEGALLLDRADPGGLVPSNFIAASEATTLLELVGAAAAPRFEPRRFSQTLARAYEKTFALDVEEKPLEPSAPPVPEEFVHQADPATVSGPGVRAAGLLGPIEAWARHDAGRLVDLEIRGDFIAPATLPRALAEALRGCATDAQKIRDRIDTFLDDDEHYLLGLKPADLSELIARAAGTTP